MDAMNPAASRMHMLHQSDLRLSAVRAFLGSIYPEMRVVKIRAEGSDIILSVILDKEPSEMVREAISVAATEISADFDGECRMVVENIIVNAEPLAKENCISEGWIYQRAE